MTSAAVEIDSFGSGRGQVVKCAVFALNRSGDFAVYRAHGRKLEERASQRLDDGGDGRALATDDRFLGSISDQHVNASSTADRCPHGFRGARHDSGNPVDRLLGRDRPQPASRITRTGQLGMEKGR